MKNICILMFIGLASLSEHAEETFDTLQILERNKERIKATGNLRSESKLMKVISQFRDNDLLISGNDYRYGYITSYLMPRFNSSPIQISAAIYLEKCVRMHPYFKMIIQIRINAGFKL